MAEDNTTQYIDLPNYTIKADKDWEDNPSGYDKDIGSEIVKGIMDATRPKDASFFVDSSFASIQRAETFDPESGSCKNEPTLHTLAQKFGNNVFSLGIPGIGFIYGMLKTPPSLGISCSWEANGVGLLAQAIKKLAQDGTYQSIVQMLGNAQLPPVLRWYYFYKNVF